MASSQPRLLTKTEKPKAPVAPEQPGIKKASPYVLLTKEWQIQADAVAHLLSEDSDFFVVGVLGGQGLGKSSFLNALLGVGAGEGAGLNCPPFAVASEAHWLAGQHCSSGIQIRVSSDGIVALDTQPLFSLSVLGDVARWDRPSLALAAPAVAAAGAIKSSVVPFEAAQRLMELQMGVLLLSACHLVVVLCDGLQDAAAYEYLQTVEMLARGIPDPSLPQLPLPPAPLSGGAAGGRQAQQAQHLADVLLLHVVDPLREGSGVGGGMPGVQDVAALEQRLRGRFAPSRLRLPGFISLLDFLQPGASTAGTHRAPSPASPDTAAPGLGRLNYWVVPRCPGACGEGDTWRERLLGRLLRYPRRDFARRVSQRAWGAGVRAAWEAVCKSGEVLEFYTRLVGTLLKGAGGWGLAR